MQLHIAVFEHKAGTFGLQLDLFIVLFVRLLDGGVIRIHLQFAVFITVGIQQHGMIPAGHHSHLAVRQLQLRQGGVFIVIMGFGYSV